MTALDPTPALAEALDRAVERLRLAGGDYAAAFDRLGVGIDARAIGELVDDDDVVVVLGIVLVCVEADRAQRTTLARHARAYAEADRRWRKDVHPGQLALDGIEPARYEPGEAVTHRQQLRVGLWVRSGGACEDCGRNGKGIALDVHHLRYDRYGHEEPSDVLLICRDCHERRHGRPIPPV